MRLPVSVLLVGLLLWFALAFVIDRYVLAWICPVCSKVAALKLTGQVPAGTINFPQIGLGVLAGLPLFVLAVSLIPWRAPKDTQRWAAAFQQWCQPVIWLGVALILTILGESMYLVSKDWWSTGVRSVAEAFSVSATLSIADFQFITLKGTLAAVLGLIVGVYLFLRKGVTGALRWPSA